MRLTARDACLEVRGSTLVCGVDLVVAPGESVAFVGPNGAGKSTLLRLLAGDVQASRGDVFYDDRSVTRLSAGELARSRAILGQRQADDVAFTVSDVVQMGRYVHRSDSARGPGADRDAVAAALRMLDLSGLADRPVSSLSGGERQRVAIARVLAQETPVVLLDEPTTALDLGHQQMILRLILALASEGRTVVAVLHDLSMATRFDQVALLHRGGVNAYGTPADVLTSDRLTDVYEHPVVVIDHPLEAGHLVLPGPSD